jgi:hypothetical protein
VNGHLTDPYLAVRLGAPVPSLTPGSWFIAASNAVLHASLSSVLFSLRQADISSALGMNALQSLNASGVHAMRCANVPCAKEGGGETVADSKASDTHHRAKDIGRSIRLFWLSMFIMGLASIIKADTRHRHYGRQEYTRAGVRACSETSAFVAFDPSTLLLLPVGRLCEAAQSGLFRHQHRGAQTSKSSQLCPSVGTTPTLTLHVEMMRPSCCWWDEI